MSGTDRNAPGDIAMSAAVETPISRLLSVDTPEGLEAVANHIETSFLPLRQLELEQLCAVLCRRVAMLERGSNANVRL